MADIAVIGAGSWGTTMAALLGAHHGVTLWVRRPELAQRISETHRNPDYVEALELPSKVMVTADLGQAVSGASVVIMAVPSQWFREISQQLSPHLGTGASIISLTKGLEQETLLRMTEVLAEVAPFHSSAVLTGPNLVHEIANGLPAASVLACSNTALGLELQGLFADTTLRVYTNSDVVGCELAGALKNVVAIAIGIVDGMALGANAAAALLARGLAELTRLGVTLGGEAFTFSGLAGVGDLVATCSSPHSRNRQFGQQLAHGHSPAAIEAASHMVAEGVRSAAAVVTLAGRVGVEVPIAQAVCAVIAAEISPAEAIEMLLRRQAGSERFDDTALTPIRNEGDG